MTPEHVTIEFRDGVAVVSLCNGLNEFNTEFISQINQTLDQVLRNPSAAALVVAATGRHYSNGADMSWMAGLNQRQIDDFCFQNSALFGRLLAFPLPTVAAVTGHAVAEGAYLALAMDWRVMASDTGWLWLPDARLGFRYPKFFMELLKAKLPARAIRDLVVMGGRMGGRQAVAVEAVDEAVLGGEVVARAISKARQMAWNGELSRASLHLTKADVYRQVLDQLTPEGVAFPTHPTSKL